MGEVRVSAVGAPDERIVARDLADRSERRDEHPALGDEVWRDLDDPAPGSGGIVASIDGVPVGYLRAIARRDAPPAYDLAMTVDPAHRDDTVPGLLLDAGIDLARARGAHRASLWVFGADVDSDALAAGRGLTVERELWQMRVPLPLTPPRFPDGVVVRSFEPGVDDDAWLSEEPGGGGGLEELGRTVRGDQTAGDRGHGCCRSCDIPPPQRSRGPRDGG